MWHRLTCRTFDVVDHKVSCCFICVPFKCLFYICFIFFIFISRLVICSGGYYIFTMCILPIFLYGSDCWAISKTDARKINVLNQWCLRMLLGIKWYQFVRNDDVQRLTEQPKLTAIIQSCRLTLFGHIMRMDNNADAKRILLASPPADWRRQLGRPRITWLSTVQQDLKQHHLRLLEAADLAQNRPLWRMMSTYGATQSWVACQKRRRCPSLPTSEAWNDYMQSVALLFLRCCFNTTAYFLYGQCIHGVCSREKFILWGPADWFLCIDSLN